MSSKRKDKLLGLSSNIQARPSPQGALTSAQWLQSVNSGHKTFTKIENHSLNSEQKLPLSASRIDGAQNLTPQKGQVSNMRTFANVSQQKSTYETPQIAIQSSGYPKSSFITSSNQLRNQRQVAPMPYRQNVSPNVKASFTISNPQKQDYINRLHMSSPQIQANRPVFNGVTAKPSHLNMGVINTTHQIQKETSQVIDREVKANQTFRNSHEIEVIPKNEVENMKVQIEHVSQKKLANLQSKDNNPQQPFLHKRTFDELNHENKTTSYDEQKCLKKDILKEKIQTKSSEIQKNLANQEVAIIDQTTSNDLQLNSIEIPEAIKILKKENNVKSEELNTVEESNPKKREVKAIVKEACKEEKNIKLQIDNLLEKESLKVEKAINDEQKILKKITKLEKMQFLSKVDSEISDLSVTLIPRKEKDSRDKAALLTQQTSKRMATRASQNNQNLTQSSRMNNQKASIQKSQAPSKDVIIVERINTRSRVNDTYTQMSSTQIKQSVKDSKQITVLKNQAEQKVNGVKGKNLDVQICYQNKISESMTQIHAQTQQSHANKVQNSKNPDKISELCQVQQINGKLKIQEQELERRQTRQFTKNQQDGNSVLNIQQKEKELGIHEKQNGLKHTQSKTQNVIHQEGGKYTKKTHLIKQTEVGLNSTSTKYQREDVEMKEDNLIVNSLDYLLGEEKNVQLKPQVSQFQANNKKIKTPEDVEMNNDLQPNEKINNQMQRQNEQMQVSPQQTKAQFSKSLDRVEKMSTQIELSGEKPKQGSLISAEILSNSTILSKPYFNPGSNNVSRKQTPVPNFVQRTPTSINNNAPTTLIKQENIDKNLQAQKDSSEKREKLDLMERKLKEQENDKRMTDSVRQTQHMKQFSSMSYNPTPNTQNLLLTPKTQNSISRPTFNANGTFIISEDTRNLMNEAARSFAQTNPKIGTQVSQISGNQLQNQIRCSSSSKRISSDKPTPVLNHKLQEQRNHNNISGGILTGSNIDSSNSYMSPMPNIQRQLQNQLSNERLSQSKGLSQKQQAPPTLNLNQFQPTSKRQAQLLQMNPSKNPSAYTTPNKERPLVQQRSSQKEHEKEKISAMISLDENSYMPHDYQMSMLDKYEALLNNTLPIPLHYKNLLKLFCSLDTALNFLKTRKQQTTLTNIAGSIQQLERKTLNLENFSQILNLAPSFFNHKWELRAKGWDMIIEVPKNIKEIIASRDSVIPSEEPFEEQMLSSLLQKRQKFIESKLVAITLSHFRKFKRANSQNPELKELLSIIDPLEHKQWPAQFDIQSLPEIGRYPLKEQPKQAKQNTVAQFIEQTNINRQNIQIPIPESQCVQDKSQNGIQTQQIMQRQDFYPASQGNLNKMRCQTSMASTNLSLVDQKKMMQQSFEELVMSGSVSHRTTANSSAADKLARLQQTQQMNPASYISQDLITKIQEKKARTDYFKQKNQDLMESQDDQKFLESYSKVIRAVNMQFVLKNKNTIALKEIITQIDDKIRGQFNSKDLLITQIQQIADILPDWIGLINSELGGTHVRIKNKNLQVVMLCERVEQHIRANSTKYKELIAAAQAQAANNLVAAQSVPRRQ